MKELENITGGIAVTGALGNLGTKLLRHFARRGAPRLVGLDVRQAGVEATADLRRIAPEVDVRYIACDLADPADRRWRDVMDDVSVVVHLAAQNPFPEATWGDATASADMTFNTALMAADSATVTRYILATSNHVMGRYLARFGREVGSGALTTEIDPGVGTVWDAAGKTLDSTAYAAAKWAGERLCRSLGARCAGKTSFACIRIGWCQPGENLPETLNASGTPTQARTEAVDDELARIDRWFREMWLSNSDLARVFECAVAADAASWPNGFALVNGMSNNTGMAWSLDAGRRLIGYEAQDDVYGST